MTSGTGWRETARMSAKSTFAPKPWPLSRIVRRMLIPFGRGVEGSERRVVLPRGLADCRAHHDLEDLVLAEARCPCCGDVVVGDLVGVLGDLVDQRAQRLGEPCVVERGAALGVRRPAVSFFYPRDQRFACLCDIRHAVLPSSYSLKRATATPAADDLVSPPASDDRPAGLDKFVKDLGALLRKFESFVICARGSAAKEPVVKPLNIIARAGDKAVERRGDVSNDFTHIPRVPSIVSSSSGRTARTRQRE